MNAKNSFSITARNVRLSFKLILFVTVLSIIVLAVLISVFTPLFNEMKDFLENDGLSLQNVSWSQIIETLLTNFSDFFEQNRSDLLTAIGYTYLVIFIARMLISATLMPTAYIIGNQMKTNFTENFVPAFIVTLKKSLLYSLLSSLIVLILDVPFSILVLYLITLLFPVMSVFAVTSGLVLMIVYLSIRMTITCQWLPHMIIGKLSLLPALKKTLSDLPKTFTKSVIGVGGIVAITLVLILTTAVPTLFIGPIIVIPLMIIMLTSFSMVVYCDVYKQNYFYDARNIVINEIVEESDAD